MLNAMPALEMSTRAFGPMVLTADAWSSWIVAWLPALGLMIQEPPVSVPPPLVCTTGPTKRIKPVRTSIVPVLLIAQMLPQRDSVPADLIIVPALMKLPMPNACCEENELLA